MGAEPQPKSALDYPADHGLPAPVWLFSASVDLLTFGGSTLLSLALLAIGYWQGWDVHENPEWLWIVSILLIDVAHVYATGFRVYFEPGEFRRRRWLYVMVPLLSFVLGAAIYSEGRLLFWRCLAYLAVFHFIRQQYGWVALYRSREMSQRTAEKRDVRRTDGLLDSAAIYLATLYPLVYWHTHPRHFSWFVETDFVRIPEFIETLLRPVYWIVLSAYCLRSVIDGIQGRAFNPGRDLVVLSTALLWYLGIVTFNSDAAFTVTNVIAHGIPYIVLVFWYRCQTHGEHEQPVNPRPDRRRPLMFHLAKFLGVIWVLAYLEELLWDCGLWHERSWLFGNPWDIGDFDQLLVPLLAVPQITHYVLDGFIWRRRSNPDLARLTQADTLNVQTPDQGTP